MPISEMNHFTVLTSDLEKTMTFYKDLLGLDDGFRPQFADAGAWLYASGRPVLHVMADCKMPTDPAGVLDHMAFSASNLVDIAARLEKEGVKFFLKRQVTTKTVQLFCHDPSGAKVELNFLPDEKLPDGIEVVLGH
jgi:catechol 2,3-dioxygenase-like lactoylglutathione lyase family enzyme